MLFRDRDLALRLGAAALPAPAGYALTRDLTPRLAGERQRHAARVVREKVHDVLGDGDLAALAAERFAGSIACDDLDALTGWTWPRAARRAWLTVEGEEHLPRDGRAVLATFHVSGGFRVYDVLHARGLCAAVLGAPPERAPTRYQRYIDRARAAYLERELPGRTIHVGPGVPRAALRSPASHLAAGGVVVTALDVLPSVLGIRDAGRTTLFGRAADLPIGLLRLAAGSATPVVPFDARLERGRRVLRLHPPILSRDAGEILDRVVAALEASIRARPWDWQGWLEVDRLFVSSDSPRPDTSTRRGATGTSSAHPREEVSSASTATHTSTDPTDPNGATIAIVIPIHDAASDTRRCVESVLAHAPPAARVVLVDDASSDPELRTWLDLLPARDGRILLLRNETNLGFVKTSNRGLTAASGSDVILLNSDTVVPPRFVERLAAAARHTPATGIVSPLTNNGTIFSVPEFMRDNPLPPGFDVDALDALVEITSERKRPQVVTAHGFCMLVRKDVIACVGTFDEEHFARGYGEENDLCERAKAAGFEVRVCDDLFVYHRGGASFGTEADDLVPHHLEILEQQHPGYRRSAQDFIARNPLAPIQERIRSGLARHQARRDPSLLLLLHASPFADPRREGMGGTQYHVIDLVGALALPRVVVAWPNIEGTAAAEILRGDWATARHYLLPRPRRSAPLAAQRFLLRDPEAEAHVEEILDLFDVRAVHLHHLAWWPVGLWRLLAARGIAYVQMLQDYYAVCPSWNLLDLANSERCACDAGTLDDRRRCLGTWLDACGVLGVADVEAFRAAHRGEFRELLEHASAAVAPCEKTREIVARAHPGAAIRWHVIPYGWDGAAPASPDRPLVEATTRPPRSADAPLRVALVGAVAAPWKGARQSVEVIRLTRSLPVEWHVFGDAEAFGFPEQARAAAGDPSRLVFHGRYAREEIVGLLRRRAIDVTLLLSPWDETYCYTLSESWAAGIPAIVSDRGALAERVRASGAGIVVDASGVAAEALDRLARDPGELATLRRNVATHRELTLAENAARHRAATPEVFAALAPRSSAPPFSGRDLRLEAALVRAGSSPSSADQASPAPESGSAAGDEGASR